VPKENSAGIIAMSHHESAELQHIIHQRIVYLRVLVEVNIATATDKPSYSSDDNLASVMEVPVEQHVIQHSKQEIADLNKAMQRLLTGKAKNCQHCGEAISFERLKTVPVTDFCLPCVDSSDKLTFDSIN
jgi:RNA polymerase-binding transcription factor DksA